MCNKEEILKTVAAYNIIKEKAEVVVLEHIKIALGKLPMHFELKSMFFTAEDIYINYETGCMGSFDIESYSLPISCLWDENWAANLIAEIEIKKQLFAELKLKEKEQMDFNRIANEKATLLKLKEKYPDL